MTPSCLSLYTPILNILLLSSYHPILSPYLDYIHMKLVRYTKLQKVATHLIKVALSMRQTFNFLHLTPSDSYLYYLLWILNLEGKQHPSSGPQWHRSIMRLIFASLDWWPLNKARIVCACWWSYPSENFHREIKQKFITQNDRHGNKAINTKWQNFGKHWVRFLRSSWNFWKLTKLLSESHKRYENKWSMIKV